MKKLLLPILMFAGLTAQAQRLKVYKTYKDYINKISTDYQHFEEYNSKKGQARDIELKASTGGISKVIKCSKIYGYSLNDTLYRVYPINNVPARVQQLGALYYYTSINESFSITTEKTTSVGSNVSIGDPDLGAGVGKTIPTSSSLSVQSTSTGGKEYFSLSLSDSLYLLPKAIDLQQPEKFDARILALKAKFPAQSSLFDCVSTKMHDFAREFKNDDSGWRLVSPNTLEFFKDCFKR